MARRRLQPYELLEHPTRRAILALLRERPGITVGEARARLAVPLGTFHHHLRLLRQNDLVDAHLSGRRRTLYLRGASDALDAAARALLLGDAIRRTARIILAHPGGSVADVARHAERPVRTTYHHVQDLTQAGLVTSRSPTRRFDLRATERLERLLRETRKG